MEEKLGKAIIDGKLIDLDNIPIVEIDKMLEKLRKEEKELSDEIEKELKNMGVDDINGND